MVAETGVPLARRTAPPPAPRVERQFGRLVSRRGTRAAGHGWAPTLAPFASWDLTSEQTPVLWPLIAGDGLPPTGAPMGFDVLSGGAFFCDPMGWVTDDAIAVTNPNVFIFGKPGRGKSALVKAFLLRMTRFGYRSLILGDVKNEYEDLSRALGVEPFRIGPGLPGRINPLDLGPLADGWATADRGELARRTAVLTNRWLALLRGLIGSQRVPFGPTEERVLSHVLRHVAGWDVARSTPAAITIPMVWHALDNPSDDLIATCRYAARQAFFDSTRGLRDALGALCEGSLAGMFDAPSTFAPDWRAPIQTLSLRDLHSEGNETAVGIALMCLNSWGQGMRELVAPGDRRIVLRDEAWLQTRLSVEAVKALDSNLRLSRNDGDIQIVTYHKPSDPLSAGDVGSQAAQIAKDLLHLSDIRILMGQDAEVAAELRQLLGLTTSQQHLVTDWAMQAKGRALWMVGDRRFKVQTLLTGIEQQLTFTNAAVADVPGPGGATGVA
ncbi:ATP-binding protein [Nocardioides zeae]|uniref:ATP-binding protein n=1 Tax=Nocardioides imazamoxiresistens TaxID=3231893 RepID=A0ABU3Q060_9ACTN|nr:ATP-binding protein [Nocardioides zeae]MDT9594896.1 ATP-binding protein [Nocardioides zeae]